MPVTPVINPNTEQEDKVNSILEGASKSFGKLGKDLFSFLGEVSLGMDNQSTKSVKKLAEYDKLRVKMLKSAEDSDKRRNLLEEMNKMLAIQGKSMGFSKDQIEDMTKINIEMRNLEKGSEELGKLQEKPTDIISEQNKLLYEQKNIFDKLDDGASKITEQLTGTAISFKSVLSTAVALKNVLSFASLDRELFQMTRSYASLNSQMKNTEGLMRKMETTSGALRIEDKQLQSMMEVAGEYGMNITQEMEGYSNAVDKNGKKLKDSSNSMIALGALMERTYGIAGAEVMQLGGEMSQYYAHTAEGQEQAFKSTQKIVGAMAQLKMTANDMKTTFKAVSNLLPQIALRSAGALNPAMVERTSLAMVGLTKDMKQYGIAADQASQVVNNLLDVDKIGENAYALSKLGITMQDALYNPDVVAKKTAEGIGNIAKEIQSVTNPLLKQQMIKMYQGAIPKDILMKLKSGANLTPAEIKTMMDKTEKMEAGKKALQELQTEALENFGIIAQDLKPLFSTFVKLFTPAIRMITIVAGWIGKLLNFLVSSPIFGTMAKVIGTIALLGPLLKIGFGFFKGLLAGISKGGMPVVVMNQGGGAGGGMGDILDMLKGKGKTGKLLGNVGKFLKSPIGMGAMRAAGGVAGAVMIGMDAKAGYDERKKAGDRGFKLAGGTAIDAVTGTSLKEKTGKEIAGAIGKNMLKGAAIGMMIGGPVGAAIGAAVGGLATGIRAMVDKGIFKGLGEKLKVGFKELMFHGKQVAGAYGVGLTKFSSMTMRAMNAAGTAVIGGYGLAYKGLFSATKVLAQGAKTLVHGGSLSDAGKAMGKSYGNELRVLEKNKNKILEDAKKRDEAIKKADKDLTQKIVDNTGLTKEAVDKHRAQAAIDAEKLKPKPELKTFSDTIRDSHKGGAITAELSF